MTVTDLESYQSGFDGEPGYLDWARFGPLSPEVRAEALADAELLGSGRPSSIEMVTSQAAEATELVAELLRADPAQVVMQPSTTHGLMHVLYGMSGAVMLARTEFPSLTVTATRAAAMGRTRVQWIDPPDGFVTVDAVRAALTEETTAVAVSLVDYRTGYRADLSALREVIGDRLLIVDAIQGFGVVDADYDAADVVCANGYKWVRAGRGTGFARFSERAIDQLQPVLSGPAGVEGDLPFDTVPPPVAGAGAFRVTAADPLAVARLRAALREISDVGVDAIESEVTDRAGDVIFMADRYDVPVRTPRDPERRAGIVTLAPAPDEAAPMAAALANHGITLTVRAGLVRVAAHAGTAESTLRLFGDALAEVAAHRRS